MALSIRIIAVLALALLLQQMATAQLPVAPPPHPTLDGVVKEYVRLGLPLPPTDAELSIHEYWFPKHILCTNGIPSEELRQNERFRILGFRIVSARPDHFARFISGTNGTEEIDDPTELQKITPSLEALNHLTGDDQSFAALAVMCKLRGWNELASHLYTRAVGINLEWRKEYTLIHDLRVYAFWHWETRLEKRNSDRKEIYGHLKRLMDGCEDLRDSKRQLLLKRLAATVTYQRKSKAGSIEGLIDDLVEYHEDEEYSSNKEGEAAYWKLVDMGFDAVPTLIAHFDDERLSRSIRESHLTVANLCSKIVNLLSGNAMGHYTHAKEYALKPNQALEWLEKARNIGEEKFLLRMLHSLPRGFAGPYDSADIESVHHIVRVIGVKYPKHLPAIYRASLQWNAKEDYKDFAIEILASKLTNREKIALFEEGMARDELEHRVFALEGLAKLNQDLFRKHFIATMQKIRSLDDLDHLEFAATFSPLFRSLTDPECWQKMAEAAKILPAIDRAYTISRVVDLSPPDKDDSARKDRIQFLMQFLGDQESTKGPSTAGEMVRDVAAKQLLKLLRVRLAKPQEFAFENGPLSLFLIRAVAIQKATEELARLKR